MALAPKALIIPRRWVAPPFPDHDFNSGGIYTLKAIREMEEFRQQRRLRKAIETVFTQTAYENHWSPAPNRRHISSPQDLFPNMNPMAWLGAISRFLTMLGTWSALLFGISITWKALTWCLGILMRMYANHDAPGASKGAAYGWEILMPSWTQVRKARDRRRKVKEQATTAIVLDHLGLPTHGDNHSLSPKENLYTIPRDQHSRFYAGTQSPLPQLHDPTSSRYPEIQHQLLRAEIQKKLLRRDKNPNNK
jgi:hypothetical protein